MELFLVMPCSFSQMNQTNQKTKPAIDIPFDQSAAQCVGLQNCFLGGASCMWLPSLLAVSSIRSRSCSRTLFCRPNAEVQQYRTR